MVQKTTPKGKRGQSNSGGDPFRLDVQAMATNAFPQGHIKAEQAGKRRCMSIRHEYYGMGMGILV